MTHNLTDLIFHFDKTVYLGLRAYIDVQSMRFRVSKIDYFVRTHHFEVDTLLLHLCNMIDQHYYVQ